MWQGQNKEDMIISNYFGDHKGALLDLGANDGYTFSNSFYLLNNGWKGILVDPSPSAYEKLETLYQGNPDVHLMNVAIGNHNTLTTLYDSDSLLNNGDSSLVSTCVKNETKRWEPLNMKFDEVEVEMWNFKYLIHQSPIKSFDFISIDCEGLDISILKQINLSDVNCRCLCIEHNSVKAVVKEIRAYCSLFGLNKEIGYNAENIILAK
jgi:FkbM family methyltransferase